jgi:hypothetical protein
MSTGLLDTSNRDLRPVVLHPPQGIGGSIPDSRTVAGVSQCLQRSRVVSIERTDVTSTSIASIIEDCGEADQPMGESRPH